MLLPKLCCTITMKKNVTFQVTSANMAKLFLFLFLFLSFYLMSMYFLLNIFMLWKSSNL
jgi:hypothetical protein